MNAPDYVGKRVEHKFASIRATVKYYNYVLDEIDLELDQPLLGDKLFSYKYADFLAHWNVLDENLPIGEQLELGPILKCECGVDSVGGNIHSDYCPKYERPSLNE